MDFVCHFVGVGAVPNPIKHTLVAEAVPGHIRPTCFKEKSTKNTLLKSMGGFVPS